jgi:two-component system, chemotaxis family, sensor kinase CheA
MIFRPRFTTAATVSSVSGRGVGLDVVETEVEQAGGAVRIRTQRGQGAEFEIRLPAAFGILRVLLIASSGSHYCVDISQVLDRFEIDSAAVKRAGEAESVRWKDETLPVSSLRQLLDQPPLEHSGKLQIIVCKVAGEDGENDDDTGLFNQAIIVDAIDGLQEILVRSLGHHAARWTGVAAAAELRDGSVALVLDLASLVRESA